MIRATRQNSSERRMVRAAIYTRKSSEEGLDQDFNSLDAQREAAEAFVKSQAHEGWICLADKFDDGGYTGGNMERPALKRLMADIAAGKIDVIVVYKFDRLSRSLLDFTKMLEVFEKNNCAFVAFTQQINSATPMGRLMMNVLMSFAQFEREMVSERTRDKIAAARRKGKWSGGHPILGYDVDPDNLKLVVNEVEAAKVQTIFELYLEYEGLIPVIRELDRRGWMNKRWVTRKGVDIGGKPFTKTSLHKLLTNVAYVGKVRYKTEVHEGEHDGIIGTDVWQRVQAILKRNGVSGGALVRNKFGALLKGLVRCVSCNCAMTPAHTTRNQNRRYRYYTCSSAQKRGWNTCPSKSVPAAQLEQIILQQIRRIGLDPELVAETFAQAEAQANRRISDLENERRSLERDLSGWDLDVRTLTAQMGTSDPTESYLARLADLQDRIRGGERRLTEVRQELESLQQQRLAEHEVETALAQFDPVWECLTLREQ